MFYKVTLFLTSIYASQIHADDFLYGTISGQNGWASLTNDGAQPDSFSGTSMVPGDEATRGNSIVGVFANGDGQEEAGQVYEGDKAWWFKRGYESPGTGTPQTPNIEPAGFGSDAASSDGIFRDVFQYKVYFRAAASGDGSMIAIISGKADGSDRSSNFLKLDNHASGVKLMVFEPSGMWGGDYAEYSTGLAFDQWHLLEATMLNSADLDIWVYKINGVIVGSSQGYFNRARIDNAFAYEVSTAVKFQPSHANYDAGKLGFYFDNLEVHSWSSLDEAGTKSSYTTGFEPAVGATPQPTEAPTVSPPPADLIQVCDSTSVNCNPVAETFDYLAQKTISLTSPGFTTVNGATYDNVVQYNAEMSWGFVNNFQICEADTTQTLNCGNVQMWLSGASSGNPNVIVPSSPVTEGGFECCIFNTDGLFFNEDILDANSNLFFLFDSATTNGNDVVVMTDLDNPVISADQAQLFLWHLDDETTMSTTGTDAVEIVLTVDIVDHSNNPDFDNSACDSVDTVMSTIQIGSCTLTRSSKPDVDKHAYILPSTQYEQCSTSTTFTSDNSVLYETSIVLPNQRADGCYHFQPGNDVQPLEIYVSQDFTDITDEDNLNNVLFTMTSIGTERCLPYQDYILDHAVIIYTMNVIIGGTDITFVNQPYLDSITNPLTTVQIDCQPVAQGGSSCEVILKSSQCERIYKNTLDDGCVFDRNDRYIIYGLDIAEVGNPNSAGTTTITIPEFDSQTETKTFNLADCTTPDFITIENVTDFYNAQVQLQNQPSPNWSTQNPFVTLQEDLTARVYLSDATTFSGLDLQLKIADFKFYDVDTDELLTSLYFPVQDKIKYMQSSNNLYYYDAHFCRHFDSNSCSRFYENARVNNYISTNILSKYAQVCQLAVDDTKQDFFTFSPELWLRNVDKTNVKVVYTLTAKLEVCSSGLSARRLGHSNEIPHVHITSEDQPLSNPPVAIQYVTKSGELVFDLNSIPTISEGDGNTKNDRFIYSVLVIGIIGITLRLCFTLLCREPYFFGMDSKNDWIYFVCAVVFASLIAAFYWVVIYVEVEIQTSGVIVVGENLFPTYEQIQKSIISAAVCNFIWPIATWAAFNVKNYPAHMFFKFVSLALHCIITAAFACLALALDDARDDINQNLQFNSAYALSWYLFSLFVIMIFFWGIPFLSCFGPNEIKYFEVEQQDNIKKKEISNFTERLKGLCGVCCSNSDVEY